MNLAAFMVTVTGSLSILSQALAHLALSHLLPYSKCYMKSPSPVPVLRGFFNVTHMSLVLVTIYWCVSTVLILRALFRPQSQSQYKSQETVHIDTGKYCHIPCTEDTTKGALHSSINPGSTRMEKL